MFLPESRKKFWHLGACGGSNKGYFPRTSSYQDLISIFLLLVFHRDNKLQVLSVIDSNCHNMDTKEAGVLGSREPKDADNKQEIELNFTEVIKIHLPFMGISLISSSPQVNRVL